MKKITKIFFASAMAFGFGFAAQAQTDNGTINASAKIIDAIQVDGITALSFGQVTRNVDKYLPYLGTAVSNETATAQGGVTVGKFKVFAGSTSSITLTFSALTALLDGANSLAIDFNKGLSPTGNTTTVAYVTGADASIAYTPLLFGENTISSFPVNPLDDKNGIEVLVGGTVRPTSTQPSGTYSAVMTLTATYN